MYSAVRVNEIVFRSVYFQKHATQNWDTGCGLLRQVRRICVHVKAAKSRAAHQVCYVEPEVSLKHSAQVILRIDLVSHSSGVFLHKPYSLSLSIPNWSKNNRNISKERVLLFKFAIFLFLFFLIAGVECLSYTPHV